MNRETYENLYRRYSDDHFITKLKNYAFWTIPSSFPSTFVSTNANQPNQRVENDYQSIGAILVNNLAAKLAGILFPITQSFFKISPSDKMKRLYGQTFNTSQDEIDSALVELENLACKRLYLNAAYAQLVQAIRYLVITGNCLLIRRDAKTIVYSLHNYTVSRNAMGEVLDIVVKETYTYDSLPKAIQEAVEATRKGVDPKTPVDVYTRVQRDVIDGNVIYRESQQVNNIDVGKPNTYPAKLCPYIPVVWNIINGDSYGRGHVEDHAGDFAKLSDLSAALAIYEVDACKVVNLVKPGAVVDLQSLNEATTGTWVQADPQAVQKFEAGEYQKIQQLGASIQNIYVRLSAAFLYTGNMRDAERVTAEEIRQNAKEAEQTLGGVYSQLSLGMHLPLAHILTNEVQPLFVTALASNEVELEVVTGMSALGRTSEVQQLLMAIQELAAIVPAAKQISARFNTERIVDLVLQSHGVKLSDVMLSKEQLEQQQQQNIQAMQAIDPMNQVQATQQVLQ